MNEESTVTWRTRNTALVVNSISVGDGVGPMFTLDVTLLGRLDTLEKAVNEIREKVQEMDDVLSAPGGPRSQILYEECEKECNNNNESSSG